MMERPTPWFRLASLLATTVACSAGDPSGGGSGGAPVTDDGGVAESSSGDALVESGREAGDASDGSASTGDDGGTTPTPVPSDPTGKQAARTRAMMDGIGVNTHIDFPGYKTIGIPALEKAIDYVGNGMLTLLRDCPGEDGDLTTWPQVAKDTGVKFDAFINEGAPSVYQDNLGRMEKMVQSGGGYVFSFEGGNEEDDTYPVGLGNSQQQAAAFQPTVWAAGKQFGVPVFQLTFGSGWASSPTGDYATVGDQSAYATYANAHTYPQVDPYNDVQSLDHDALLATPGKPVAHSEWGWNVFVHGAANGGYGWCSEATCASYDAEFILDAFAAGCPYYFRYELFDDDALENANSWGLFYDDGTPKQSATAIRVLFQLLGDAGAQARTFNPGKLDYTLAGMPAFTGGRGGQDLVFQKSDGSFWIALWNEQVQNDTAHGNADIAVAPVPITLTLGTEATSVDVFDVLAQSTTPVQSAAHTKVVAIDLPAHPMLVKVVRP